MDVKKVTLQLFKSGTIVVGDKRNSIIIHKRERREHQTEGRRQQSQTEPRASDRRGEGRHIESEMKNGRANRQMPALELPAVSRFIDHTDT